MAVMLFVTIMIWAVPAQMGLWRKITLSNGSQVFAELRGDEFGSFLADRQGHGYIANSDGTYRQTTIEEAVSEMQKSEGYQESHSSNFGLMGARIPVSPNAIGIQTDKTIFQGTKKGLVILAEYNDVKFSTTTPSQFGCTDINSLYTKIINQQGLNMTPFQGSVKDYFIDQSRGQFTLDFDIVGPVTLSQDRAYYGSPIYSNAECTKVSYVDSHRGPMAYEAIQKAEAAGVDFSKYDWNNDGIVDQVFILYAGQSQANGGAEECIWPHEWTLSSAAANESARTGTFYYKDANGNVQQWSKGECGSLIYDGKTINTYACSNELATNRVYDTSTNQIIVNGTQIDGVGTFCHEFAHCLGFADLYDTSYKYSGCEMSYWDLMSAGNYNGSWNGGNSSWAKVTSGYSPAGFSGFERWCAGWLEPKVLSDPQKITHLKPLGGTSSSVNDGGDFYVIYADGSDITGEYYTLENRQYRNWDKGLPWCGLLICYVDYDATIWGNNKVNSMGTSGHERMTTFQAAGKDYIKEFNFDAYPWKVEYLPKHFLSTNSFYDADGATMAGKLNTWLSENTYSSTGKPLSNYVQISTTDVDALTTSTSPSAYYYGSNSTSTAFADHEIWNIQRGGTSSATKWLIADDDATVSFNYRSPESSMTLDLNQTTTTAQTFTAGYYSTITINKDLSSTKWSTIWLPFDMTYRELQTAFGDNVQLGSFTGVTTEGSSTVLNFSLITLNGLKAYTPYIIKPSKDVTGSTFSNMQVSANADVSITTTDGWKFIGTKTYAAVPSGDIFLSNNNYYYSTGTSKLKAYRAYFVPSGSNSKAFESTTTDNVIAKIVNNQHNEDADDKQGVILDPNNPESPLFDPNVYNQTTAIKTVKYSESKPKSDVYNLNGQWIGSSDCVNFLQKGIYIVNGKKVTIK